MHSHYLFGPFYRKYTQGVPVTNNIYADPLFAKFYNETIDYGSQFSDIDFYRRCLKQDDIILEIGTGNGRVFNVLINENFNIYGIEPEIEMIQYIYKQYKNRIFITGIEHLSCLNGLKFSKVIIPATTISLFSKELVIPFFKEMKSYLTFGGKIIFDIIKPEFGKQTSNQIQTIKTDEGTFFLGNAIIDQYYVLNIYTKQQQTEKIGYSKKYLHTTDYFQKLANELNYKFNIIQSSNTYQFLEMTNIG